MKGRATYRKLLRFSLIFIIFTALLLLFSTIVFAEDTITIYEVEPNNSIEKANLLGQVYAGKTIKIYGTITDYYYDVDVFRVDLVESGTIEVLGIWVGDYYGLGLEDNLYINLRDANDNPVASAKVLGTGIAMHLSLEYDLTPGTYYVSVIQISNSDIHVGQAYALRVQLLSSQVTGKLLGDINEDGDVNAVDVSMAMRHVLGIELLKDSQITIADVNSDGKIDITDVTIIMQRALGLIDGFTPKPEPITKPPDDTSPPPPSSPSSLLPYRPMHLEAHDGTYLGKLTTNTYDRDGIYNEYGSFGSEYSSTSIWNEYGTYGSKYSSQSAFNDYTSTPPNIVVTSTGQLVGRLTTNKYLYDAVSPYILYGLLLERGL